MIFNVVTQTTNLEFKYHRKKVVHFLVDLEGVQNNHSSNPIVNFCIQNRGLARKHDVGNGPGRKEDSTVLL